MKHFLLFGFGFVLRLQIVTVRGNGIRIDTSTGFFVDDFNRTRIFHGGKFVQTDLVENIYHSCSNVVEKVFPFIPVTEGPGCMSQFNQALCDDDIDNLVSWGFNAVRLGVMWQAVNPIEGFYNYTYLNQVKRLVKKLYKRGIWTLIDAHQDTLGERFCGEGIPDWVLRKALLFQNWDLKNVSHPFAFPFPFKYDLGKDPETGFPDIKKCQQHNFGNYYFSYETQLVWDSIYRSPEIRRDFAGYWKAVAKIFKATPGVLGYELINEPNFSKLYAGPKELVEKGISDSISLLDLYRASHAAIREEDAESIVFYAGLTSGEYLGLFSAKLVTDFTPEQSPGGLAYQDRQSYVYHIYCESAKSGEPTNWIECMLLIERTWQVEMEAKNKLGGGGMLTEFGAVGEGPGSLNLLHLMTKKAAENSQSWMYWQFKDFDDITTQNVASETFYYKNGTLQSAKVAALSEPYASHIAGTIVKCEQNDLRILVSFIPAIVSNMPTIVVVPRHLNVVVIILEGSMHTPKVQFEKNQIHITHSVNKTCLTCLITFQISFGDNFQMLY